MTGATAPGSHGGDPRGLLPNAYKRFVPDRDLEGVEALGQLGGSGNLEDDIDLCRYQTIEDVFLQYLPKPGRILEAGCGRGRWVFYLRRKGYDIEGIDIAGSAVRAARAFDPAVPITQGDVLSLPFPNDSFEGVISLGVVEHFEDGPDAAFIEVRRVLRRGGLFLVTVPTQNVMRKMMFNKIKAAQLAFKKLRGERLAFEEYRYSRRQFSELLERSGFSTLDCRPDDFVSPRNMGLFTDSRFLRSRVKQWELNTAGRALNTLLSSVSPWLHCSGTLWVTRKEE